MPGSWNHPEQWVPGVSPKSGFPESSELRVPGATRNSGFVELLGTPGFRSHQELRVLGATLNIGFPVSHGIWFPGVSLTTSYSVCVCVRVASINLK